MLFRSRRQADCLDAATQLETLIKASERPGPQLLRPRCLGALSQLESHLAAFRWSLETATDLGRAVADARRDCPAPQASGLTGQ